MAVVVDDHGRQRRDECGCYVTIVDPSEDEDEIDRGAGPITDGGLSLDRIEDSDELIKCRNADHGSVWYYEIDDSGELQVYHSRYGFAPRGEQTRRQARMSIESSAVITRLVDRSELDRLLIGETSSDDVAADGSGTWTYGHAAARRAEEVESR